VDEETQPLGRTFAQIENNELVRYDVTGLFVDEPALAGECDWDYNSWRLTGPGATVSLRFARPADKKTPLVLEIEWAGWGEDTLVDVALNGRVLAERHEVHGSAWNSPRRDRFELPARALKATNIVTVTLRDDSPMVVFLREFVLLRGAAKPTRRRRA
jgi:hypothetical protein